MFKLRVNIGHQNLHLVALSERPYRDMAVVSDNRPPRLVAGIDHPQLAVERNLLDFGHGLFDLLTASVRQQQLAGARIEMFEER
jgi:hypothetical protein